MPEKYQSFTEFLSATLGGAGTTLFGAVIGRAMWHVSEARKARRRFFGRELIWELPIAVGMALIGEGLASWLAIGQPASTGLIAALAYLGPRGAEVLFLKYFVRKGGT